MDKSRTWGLVVVIIGVLTNNYVYLHDLILDRHEGMILLGWKAGIGIIVTLAVIFIGLVLLLRSPAGEAAKADETAD
ncbi:MAG: hypothetical protein IH999_09770 [Proteobacteria bacterium]|nr:hypothetical protein [Pseudomonadota bacterium]